MNKPKLKSIKITAFSAAMGQRGRVGQATATARLQHDGELPDGKVLARAYRQWQPAWTLPETAQRAPDALEAEGTFADWVVFLTSVIQRGCHDVVGAGEVWSAPTSDTLLLGIPYCRPAVARDALHWALQWAVLWSLTAEHTQKTQTLQTRFDPWLLTQQAQGLSPNAFRFGWAAMEQGIPVQAQGGLLRLGWGRAQQVWDSSFSDQTRVVGTRLARNKALTGQWLAQAGIPVPATAVAQRLEHAVKLAEQWGWPIVTKPAAQDQGTGVTPDIRDVEHLAKAFAQALHHSPEGVIVQKHVAGDDHRLLVVGGQLRMATRRIPAGVVGDGKQTLAQLVAQLNADPRRGTSKRSLLIHVALDDEAQRCLRDQALTAEDVPEAGRFVHLRRTANISTGGTAQDVTRQVHPDNRALAERACRVIGLDIAGVDFLCPDITRSWREVGGVIIEVNAQPGFRVHWLGDPERDINAEIIQLAFAGESGRIPTAAIAGSQDSTQVARRVHHIWMTAGTLAGVCTSQGVWVGQELISPDNLAGVPGARLVLNDPSVEAAVIALPVKALRTFGHPCDRYDVVALLDAQADPFGAQGSAPPSQMAEVLAQVLERAVQAVVVNAEDELCLAMRARAGAARQVLVGLNADCPALQRHREAGGEAAFVQKHHGTPWLILAHGAAQYPLMPVDELGTDQGAEHDHPVRQALFAAALTWAQGIPHDTIRTALARFCASPEQRPVTLADDLSR